MLKIWLAQYGLFVAEVFTIVLAIMVVIGFILMAVSKSKETGRLVIKFLNESYEGMRNEINAEILSKKEQKKLSQQMKQKKAIQDKTPADKKRIFVINFQGDLKASAAAALREEVTAVLTVARAQDEVVVKLESSGGMMHAYGFAASQLMRIKARAITLTVAIDKVAASGGYMMACVANHILAAPFAIVGSIGVVAQFPNFHRLLDKHDIDYEVLTAGEYKRTMTMFGENTDKQREKFKAELNDAHALFKDFIVQNRPVIEMDKAATGEYWFAVRAKTMGLVDDLMTSDDYLLKASETADIYTVTYRLKKSFLDKLTHATEAAIMALRPRKAEIIS